MSTTPTISGTITAQGSAPQTTGPTLSERAAAPVEQWLAIGEAISRKLRCALPGIITAFDSTRQVVTVLPAIREHANGAPIALPQLNDVPILVPRGGGHSFTLSIQAGDECLLVFNDLCIDAWWQWGCPPAGNGMPQLRNPMLPWRHHLGDAVAILGPWSQPRVLPNYSQSAAQLRTDDGSSYLDFAKGQTTFTDNISVANGSTATLSTNTGQLFTITNGFISNVDSAGSLNDAFFQSQLDRLAASQDCNDLANQSGAMLETLNTQLSSIASLISQLAALIVVPTDLPSVITWVKSMIAPMALAHANALLQQAALAAKLTAIQDAITNRQNQLGCS